MRNKPHVEDRGEHEAYGEYETYGDQPVSSPGPLAADAAFDFVEEYEAYDDQPAPRSGFRVAGGVFDFIGVMVCTVLILALMALMTALFSWLRGDLTATFSGIGQNLNEAVLIDDQPGGHTVTQPTENP